MTGLDPRRDEIISWATVPITDGRVVLREARSGLVRPTSPLAVDAITVHGLRPVDLTDAPPAPSGLAPLFEAIDGRTLIAHCAPVERAFLAKAARALDRRAPAVPIDTEVLGRRVLRAARRSPPPRVALSGLAEWLDVPVHRMHDAAGDALTTAQVFLALVARLERRRPQTVRSLERRRLRA